MNTPLDLLSVALAPSCVYGKWALQHLAPPYQRVPSASEWEEKAAELVGQIKVQGCSVREYDSWMDQEADEIALNSVVAQVAQLHKTAHDQHMEADTTLRHSLVRDALATLNLVETLSQDIQNQLHPIASQWADLLSKFNVFPDLAQQLSPAQDTSWNWLLKSVQFRGDPTEHHPANIDQFLVIIDQCARGQCEIFVGQAVAQHAQNSSFWCASRRVHSAYVAWQLRPPLARACQLLDEAGFMLDPARIGWREVVRGQQGLPWYKPLLVQHVDDFLQQCGALAARLHPQCVQESMEEISPKNRKKNAEVRLDPLSGFSALINHTSAAKLRSALWSNLQACALEGATRPSPARPSMRL